MFRVQVGVAKGVVLHVGGSTTELYNICSLVVVHSTDKETN